MIEFPAGTRLVLASSSLRRSQLLHSAGLQFEVVPADIDESTRPGEGPEGYVRRLSVEKAAAVAQRVSDAVIVAADTTVDVDGAILEKPLDDADARRMLDLLSGRTHRVHTGVTVLDLAGAADTTVVTTVVEFVELRPSIVDWYLATGDHEGKAGAYGVQGAAAALVRRIEGSVTNVIGLPLAETIEMLRRTTDQMAADTPKS